MIQINIILYVGPSKISKAPQITIRDPLTGKLIPKQRKGHSPATDLTPYGRKWLSSSPDLSIEKQSQPKSTRKCQREIKTTGKQSQGTISKLR